MRQKRRDQVVVRLKRRERKRIEEMLWRGIASAREIRRAMILRMLDQGKTSPKTAEAVGVMATTVRDIARRYEKGGLDFALRDRPRPGQKPRVTAKQKSHIIAMACSSPPEGYARWSISLLVEESRKRGIVKTSRETIRLLLRKHNLKPWQKKNVVYRRTDTGIY